MYPLASTKSYIQLMFHIKRLIDIKSASITKKQGAENCTRENTSVANH